MKLNNKYIIGCHVMFYEIDMVEEYLNSVHLALEDIENKENNQNLISLSDRFGCWVGFYDSSQEQYINIVKYYLKKNSIRFSKHLERKALNWSIEKLCSYQYVEELGF